MKFMSKIFQAIRTPPAVGYPILNNLADGSYICQVTQSWSGADVTVMFYKAYLLMQICIFRFSLKFETIDDDNIV